MHRSIFSVYFYKYIRQLYNNTYNGLICQDKKESKNFAHAVGADGLAAEIHNPSFLKSFANRLYRDYDANGIGDYAPHGGGITQQMRCAEPLGLLAGEDVRASLLSPYQNKPAR